MNEQMMMMMKRRRRKRGLANDDNEEEDEEETRMETRNLIGVSNNSGRELTVGGCHEMCLAVFTNLESLSRSLFQCENRLYLFSTKVFSKAEITKELR